MGFKIKPHPEGLRSWSGAYADHTDIMRYLGFEPYAKLPREFNAIRFIPLTDGREVMLTVSQGAPMRMGNFGRMIKSSRHRCHVKCPDCSASVPAGRTHQHKCRKG